jgi:gliding motility-associated-like protein
MIRNFICLIFLILFLQPVSVFSQISASDTVGCAPLVGVSFTGVAGATNILWEFGGTGISILPNPTHTFSAPGLYQVKYSATVNGVNVVYFKQITVFGKPNPSFTVSQPSTGCVPLPVTFQSTSTSNVPIINHNWVFGDGGVNSTNTLNPTHIYTVPGNFSVTLIVTDQNGCDSSRVITQAVKADPKPKAVINTSPNPPSQCSPPMNVLFYGNASVSYATNTTLIYSWDFKNGNVSSAANPPQQTFTLGGIYPTQLIVTDVNGCKDTAVKDVMLLNPVAFFSIDDTVCYLTKRRDTVRFRDTTFFDLTGAIGASFSWDYGDGVSDSLGYHIYQAPGNYLVTLTAMVGPCVHHFSKTIYVQEVIAEFSTFSPFSCSLPKTAQFTDLSTFGYYYNWGFSTGLIEYQISPASSNLQNPVLNFTYGHVNQHTIFNYDFIANILLDVTSFHGCWDTIQKSVQDTSYIASARPQPDKISGCAPLYVSFSDSSRSFEPIVAMWWDFGDGSPKVYSITPTIGHTYTNPGIYYVYQFIENSAGCKDTSYAVEIRVGSKPTANFSVSPAIACKGDPIQITNTSIAGVTPIDSWSYYSAPDNNLTNCFKSPNATFPFSNTTGSHDITLIACANGCCDTITKPAAVTINGPIAQFKVEMDCATPFNYQFVGNIQDATSWSWNFGDGVVLNNSSNATVSHTYTSSGNYMATLIAYNNLNNCAPDTFRRMIYVRDVKAVITSTAAACAGDNFLFSSAASQDHNVYGLNGYTWIWGDNTPLKITKFDTVNHVFSQYGNYLVKLIVTDTNSCRDTATLNVLISQVVANYSPSRFTTCLPGSITFTGTSVSDSPITSWAWNFGNGQTSNLQNPIHTFTQMAMDSFVVTLINQNAVGCRDTVFYTILASKPVPGFLPQGLPNRCLGDSIKFIPLVTNHSAYLWNFGDNTTSSAQTAFHTYQDSGTYTVTLTVTDSLGCQRTSTLYQGIKIQRIPIAGFWASADTMVDLCYPKIIEFIDTSIVSYLDWRYWDLGTGGNIAPNQVVGSDYLLPGTYNITLKVVTTFGCADETSRTITIKGPIADLVVSDTVICKNQLIEFEIKNMVDVLTWNWSFGDGYSELGISPVSHKYDFNPPNDIFNVILVYWAADSTCPKTISKEIYMPRVIADFNRNNELLFADTAHCLGIKDIFTNTSVNSNNNQWDFGDGTQSTQINPTHLYLNPGIYPVTLYITSQIGCKDTIIKNIEIYPVPIASASGGTVCQGSPINLSADGGTMYAWFPTTGLNASNIPNPIAVPMDSITYRVKVSNQFGCSDTAFVFVDVIHPPPFINWDTTIVIGQGVPLSYYMSQPENYNFFWTPADSLSCSNCLNPFGKPLKDIQYVLTVSDKSGCFTVQSFYNVKVLPLSSIDVPSAFTPNGDGHNDKVYVKGWGIKRLLEFNIYNRWGELVFSTNDMEVGWDGTYKGVLQNLETYAYTVVAETFVDEKPITKKGFIKLLR